MYARKLCWGACRPCAGACGVHIRSHWCCTYAAGTDIGIWNERSWGTTDYVTKLRSSLDHAGMADTQIALPDDGSGGLVESVVSAAETNATFNAAIGPIGVHYPCDHPMQRVYASGHKYWASEDYSTVADWAGAGCWGRELVRNFVRLNATSTIAWSLIWSVYEGLPYYGNGLMYAFEPWSGHYEVNSPIWTSAHWCQFTQPGWRILPVGSAAVAAGGSGALPLGGHYVTLVPADSMSEVTIVVETLEGKCLRCPGTSTQAQTLQIKLMGGLPSTKPLRLWTTNQTHQFKSMGAITPTSGTITLEVAPDSMYTLTTLEIGAHGAHDTPPPSAPFPLPYMEDFNSYANDTLARYFSDQGGSFSVFRDPGNASNGVLRQVVVDDPGANGWIRNPLPVSLIGGINASNYTVRVTARVVSPDSVTDSVGPVSLSRCISGKQSQQWVGNAPASEYLQNAGNGACLNVDGCGTNVITYDCVTTGGTCCGPECYDGLKWVYDSTSNTLTSKLRNACLGTSPSAPYSLVAQPCTGSPAQQWRVSATDHTILHTEDGLCLDAATPPTAVFVSACAFINDITAYTGGICLQVSASGNFSLTSGGSAGKVLASGPTPRGTSVLNWTFLELAWAGSGRVHASIDGTVVATTEAGTSSGTGFASVGSGWHIAEFDDFSLSTQG